MNREQITTYPEMNAKIKQILRDGDNPAGFYAAQLIEELEAQAQLPTKGQEKEIHHYIKQCMAKDEEIKRLREVCQKSLEIANTLKCECDEYNGFTCDLHSWIDSLERILGGDTSCTPTQE